MKWKQQCLIMIVQVQPRLIFFFFLFWFFGIILEKEKGKTQRMCTSPIQRIQLNERVSIKYKKENIKGVLPRA